ncbi:MAG TPA: hypothetical protein PKJ98_17890 [Verrucomicrobiota bacterium]|nr:hypothetical protein [Verrucomicrobiota bacterium]
MNRRILGAFWTCLGVAVLCILLVPSFRQPKIFAFPLVIGSALILGGWGLYHGRRWARGVVGTMVGIMTILSFERILYLHYRHYHGPWFWACCLLLLAAFYTFLFLFSGLDRDASRLDDRPDLPEES